MSQTREENSMYRYEMILFDEKVKETGKIRIKLANLIETQFKQFYRIMWNRCGQSMQHVLKNIKGWKQKHEEKDFIWLYLTLQAVGVATVSAHDGEAASNTLKLFTGI
jgi:hypothetical protein